MGERGRCLNDAEIEQLVKEGSIICSPFAKRQLQPSSLDMRLSGDGYALAAGDIGLFHPRAGQTVLEVLEDIPARSKQKINLERGFELRVGYTYLLSLEESIKLKSGQRAKSSTKSTFGRLFVNSRMVTDRNPFFDEMNFVYQGDTPSRSWLLVQPLAINMVAYPGICISQLRIFEGDDAMLAQSEVRQQYKDHPLLYRFSESGSVLEEVPPLITDGLQIHLDLIGRNQRSIAGLRVRQNQFPIELIAAPGTYKVEEYFETIKGARRLVINKGDHYLFATREVLNIPAHVSTELSPHSHKAFQGPLHFAGFIDCGFEGDLVLEVRLDEMTAKVLEDGMPLGDLIFFRNNVPRFLYGKELGSNYQTQRGPKPAKYFEW